MVVQHNRRSSWVDAVAWLLGGVSGLMLDVPSTAQTPDVWSVETSSLHGATDRSFGRPAQAHRLVQEMRGRRYQVAA